VNAAVFDPSASIRGAVRINVPAPKNERLVAERPIFLVRPLI
jgi:hypothetical protein